MKVDTNNLKMEQKIVGFCVFSIFLASLILNFYFINKDGKRTGKENTGMVITKVFHVSRTPPYGQWPIDTHKNIILGGGSSQIDGLEAGDFTFEDSNLIRWMSVVRKCVKTTFYHLIRRESSKVKSPASKPSIWLLPPLRMMFLWVSIGHCPYGGVLDTWNTLGDNQ